MQDQLDFEIDYENMPNLLITETPINNEELKDHTGSPFTETEIEGKKAYICSVPDCGKVFKYLSQINKHSITHKGNRPYPCTFQGCNKSFKRADILESHMQLHTNNLPYACDEPGCDRSFASKPALKYHKTTHTNNRVFKCEFDGCGKSFLLASQLKQHERAMNYHADDIPQSEKKEGKYISDCFVPDNESEMQKLISGLSTEGEWKIMTQKCKNNKTEEELQEAFRLFFNYIITENVILREQAKRDKEDKKPAEINTGNFVSSSSANFSPFSELSRLSESLDSDELKFLEYLKENGDSKF